ncbi:MAG TPA: lysoplasmalogenase [Spirochaetota bacterium]|nr:lysoplasmalogenase [Spirochaetota bacterium]HQP49478.1 lysoplasmalogenase [Spirochaetota bacterium]
MANAAFFDLLLFGVGSFSMIFLVREYVAFRRILSLKYVFTPLVTMTIIVFGFLSFFVTGNSLYAFLIIIGLILGLIGDTLMMLEEVNYIKHGLLFFLGAHILYIAAMSRGYSFQTWNAAVAAVLGTLLVYFYIKICRKTGEKKIPVLIYMVAISSMIFFAVSHFNNGITAKAVILSSGAVLFCISDTTLAVNQFIRPITHSTVFTWLTYGPAQFLIALSCYYPPA